MCKLCDEGLPQDHSADDISVENAESKRTIAGSRRDFLKPAGLAGAAATGAAATFLNATPATAQSSAPPATGTPGRRYVIKGGAVLSMDAAVGDFDAADVLIDGVYHCSDVAFEAGLYLAKVGLCRYTDCQNILATALS